MIKPDLMEYTYNENIRKRMFGYILGYEECGMCVHTLL